MNRFARSRASLAVALTLAAAASGCEIIANFDRSKIDAGPATEDAAAYDANYPEGDSATPVADGGTDATPAADSGTDSASPATDAGNDATVTDSGQLDSGEKDSSVVDASDGAVPHDANVPDTSTDDAGAPEDASSDDGG